MNVHGREWWAAENERFYLYIRDIINSIITLQQLNAIHNKWEINLKDNSDRITIHTRQKTIFGDITGTVIKIEMELISFKRDWFRIEIYKRTIEKDAIDNFTQLIQSKDYKCYENRIDDSYVIHLYSRTEIVEFIRSLILII